MRHLLFSSVVAFTSLATIDEARCQERPKNPGNVQVNKDPFSMTFPTAGAKAAALIDVFRDPEAGGTKIDRTSRAYDLLVGMGAGAVPKLIDGIDDSNDYASSLCIQALTDIGKPAIAAVRGLWPKLDDGRRWRLMEFMGKHDYDRGADYALDCLKSTNEELRIKAWGFLLRHKEARVKDEFYRNLEGTSKFPPCYMVIRKEPVFDDKREVELLIKLLDKDSWAAQDRGFPCRPRLARFMPNDERMSVVEALAARNATSAAPALLPILQAHGPGRGYMGALVIPLLGNWGHKEAIPELKRILATDQKKLLPGPFGFGRSYIHIVAATALWQLGDDAGRDFLLSVQGSESLVAKAFALHGTKRDVPQLASWLDDPNGDVLDWACYGLERITGVNIHAPEKRTRKSNRWDAALWKTWIRNEFQMDKPIR